MGKPIEIVLNLMFIIIVAFTGGNTIKLMTRKEARNKLKERCKNIINHFTCEIKQFISQIQRGYFHILRMIPFFRFVRQCGKYAIYTIFIMSIIETVTKSKQFLTLIEMDQNAVSNIISDLTVILYLIIGIFIFQVFVHVKAFGRCIMDSLFCLAIVNIINAQLSNRLILGDTTKVASAILAIGVFCLCTSIFERLLYGNVRKHVTFTPIEDNTFTTKLDDCLNGLLCYIKSEIAYSDVRIPKRVAVVTFRLRYGFTQIRFVVPDHYDDLESAVRKTKNEE